MKRNKRTLAFMLALLLVLSLPLGAIAFAGSSGNVETGTLEEPANSCTTYSKHFGSIQEKPDFPFIKVNNDGTATASFVTTKDCVEVSFSVYTFDEKPEPYEKQVYDNGISKKYDKAGSYSLVIQLPRCGHGQFDLYAGPIQETLNPGYGHDHLTLRAHLLYKGSTCTPPSGEPTPTPTTTPEPTPTEPTPTPTTSPDPTPTEPTPTPTTSPEPTPTEPTPTPTTSPEPTPTEPTPTPTTSPEPTPTEPTPTPTTSPEPTPTEPTPTPTTSPEPTPTAPTPTPTSTPVSTPSQGPPPTPTSTPVSTPSPEPTPTPTSTPEPTPTPEESAVPSEAPQTPEPTDDLVIIEEEPIPAGEGTGTAVDHASDGTNPETGVPLDTLPKTGEVSVLPYYLLGSLAILTGVFLLMRIGRRQKPN
ncbi:LPXTG cell wall anchor domain-containing protein [Paenibacillus sp. CAU 1782]